MSANMFILKDDIKLYSRREIFNETSLLILNKLLWFILFLRHILILLGESPSFNTHKVRTTRFWDSFNANQVEKMEFILKKYFSNVEYLLFV